MLIFLRSAALALPQILILLFLAGAKDLLSGWNQSDDAMGTLLALFLLSPAVTLFLLIVETVRCCKTKKEERRKTMLFICLAIILFVEALAIDLYLLSQVRM